MAVISSKGGLGLTAQDMEASRLVFVSVKDARPRRKVAVPVPDGSSWQQFVQQARVVQQKLKLASIDSIYLASTGERVTSLDSLQDIDELHVVEGAVPAHNGTAHTYNNGSAALGGVVHVGESSLASPHLDKHPVAAADTASSSLDVDGDAKYIKRNNMLRRTLQSMFPTAFTPTLPVTTKDIAKDGSTPHDVARANRRRSSRGRPRAGVTGRMALLVLMVVAAMLLMLYVFRRTALPDLRG